MRARRNKTAAQQCRYYEVENIHEYMVENIKSIDPLL
jgi:hypothetical protein